MIRLNDRLAAVFSVIDPTDQVMDVGCDHAFLAIALKEKYKDMNVVASDNKEGPLKHAKENIKKNHLEGKIELRFGNGIQVLDEKTDTVVISGMGGLNMIGIFKYEEAKRKRIRKIVLSPNSDVESVRREFMKMGYQIYREKLVRDGKFIYPVIDFRKGRVHYGKKDLLLGPVLRKEKSPLFLEWNQKEIDRISQLIKVLPKSFWQKRIRLRRNLKIHKTVLKTL